MPHPIHTITPDTLAYIIRYLDVSDVAAFRLSCHAVNDRLSKTWYEQYFPSRTIVLSQTDLQEFVQATNVPALGCLLEDCTIVGLAQLSAMPVQEAVQVQELLAVAFGNLKQLRQDRPLWSLTLQIQAVEHNEDGNVIPSKEFTSRKAIWDAARSTFATVMEALHTAQLAVSHRVSLFADQKGCSLTYDDFLSLDTQLASFAPFQHLQKLEASFSAMPGESSSGAKMPARMRYPAHILHDITQTISKMMPKLKVANLHWYKLDNAFAQSFPAQEASAPTETAPTETAPTEPPYPLMTHLRECALRGFYITESDLYGFLVAAKPQTLTLAYVHMTAGHWAQILQHISSPDSGITSYHLDDLLESSKLVQFNAPGAPKFPYVSRDKWPSTLSSHGVHDVIEHRLPSGRPMGSPARNRWRRDNSDEYGSRFNFYGYDFVKLNTPPPVYADSEWEQGED